MWAAAATFLLMMCWDGVVSSSGQEQDRKDGATPPTPSKQPHIIFILIDDQGFNDIGYHNPAIQTPTLDKLAAEGVKLENYYVQPICTPSRSQLLTGRYQIHTGLQHSIIRPRQPSCLPLHMDTLPERLRQAGYATHMVGKWHLGFYRKACLPTRKGFDTFFGSLTGSVDYYSYGSCDGPGLCGYDLHDNEDVAWGQEGKYSTTLFTQRARKILERHDPNERPLFLLLSLQAVHTPLQPPKSYIYPYRHMANVARRKFAAMVSTVDEAVRNVTYALRKYGFYRNSVIVYSTDNGAQPFTGGSNWPLRGRKGTYWEGGVRGVAFVHSPLLRRRRRVSKALLHITDWFPTLVGLAGGNISQSLDGYDVWSAISEGKESPRQEILLNIDPLHKPPAPSMTWGASAEGAPADPSKNLALKKPKKKKKKLLRLRPKQKSAFKLPKVNTKAKNKQKLQSLKPHLKVQSAYNLSIAGTSPFKQPEIFKSKSKRTTSQDHNLSWPQTTKTKLKLHLKSKRMSLPHQNTSLTDKNLLMTPSQSVWDTSVQAAIRVGDWKLLTGDPGHGEWVPPQVLPTLPGRWWNLERAFSAFYKTSKHKNIWLFNISADPYEREDLAKQRPDVVQQLLSRLAFYNRTAVPVYFPPDDPGADPGLRGGAWAPWVEDDDQEEKYDGIYKKVQEKNKKKRKKCRLCKLKAFFLKLNTRIMSSRI
ncbi:arylsulfatase I-like [Entelurus aequoreus]|uniref:arylsulfatase I-like n=1 Tax=Entelurus aequoreus TaxID=161455 RepID=UPI002B1E847F|nr:arylsulfatase I-like [Entelurus aequoreus]